MEAEQEVELHGASGNDGQGGSSGSSSSGSSSGGSTPSMPSLLPSRNASSSGSGSSSGSDWGGSRQASPDPAASRRVPAFGALGARPRPLSAACAPASASSVADLGASGEAKPWLSLLSPSPSPSPRRPLTAGCWGTSPRGSAGGGGGGAAAASSAAGSPSGSGGGSGAWRRRAAFVAGSVTVPQRPLGPASPPGRDILLPRLPAPALERIIPRLPGPTRAALRAASRGLRDLVDAHTAALTLRPDRRVAEALSRRGTKAYSIFPALRHATVVLTGDGPAPPSPPSPPPPPAPPAPSALGAARRALSASASAASSASRSPAWRSPPPASPPPLLPLSGWLVCCGTAPRLTSLELHVVDVALLEDLALGVTHPQLQRLELHISRTGNPHASPPVVQFMVGVLRGLTHLRIAWAGPGGEAAAAASLAHGPRRLFLDGRPRLGALLLSALGDLPRLESLELQGFLIDTEGHAVLARQWPALAGRLRRLVLSRLHLMVATNTPPGQQLGELVGGCCQLRELHADLCLPATAGAPGGAAALLISLMYASRDVAAVRIELLPLSLRALVLPGVALTEADEMAALGRLTSLRSLQVASLGAGAAAHLPALQELRLGDCCWRQVLDMLPWGGAAGGAARREAAGAEPGAGGRGEAPGADAAAGGGGAVSPRSTEGSGARDAAAAAGGAGSPCRGGGGGLRLLEVESCERLDDWHPPDRALLARVARGLLPLVDAGCRLRLKVADDAQPHIWNESDVDGKPWEPAAVWKHIKAAQSMRRLQAETLALADRLARGRLMQAARRREKEHSFVDR